MFQFLIISIVNLAVIENWNRANNETVFSSRAIS